MADTTPTTDAETTPPSGEGWISKIIHAGSWITWFFKVQFVRAFFWAKITLVIQFAITFLGMLGARFGNEDAGRLHVTLAGFAVAVLSNIVWAELAAAGLILAAADPAVRAGAVKLSDLVGKPVSIDPLVDTAKVDFMLRWLFSVAAIMVGLDCAIVAFEMWNDFAAFLLFVTLALGLAYGAASWGGTRHWLPRIQRGTLLFEGLLIGLILLNFLFPAQFGWAKVIYTRGSSLQRVDNRENMRLIRSLGSEYDSLAEERTDLVLRRHKNSDPEARIAEIDARQEEIRVQIKTLGGEGPGTLFSGWADTLSSSGGWGRGRWSLGLLILLLLGFGVYTLAKQKRIWPLVTALLLIIFLWPVARWVDVGSWPSFWGGGSSPRSTPSGPSYPAPAAGEPAAPAATPLAPPVPVATAKAESVLWPEAKAVDAKKTSENKWEFSLDSRASNETEIEVPDGARLRIAVTGTIRPDKDLAAVTPDSGWSLPGRAVHRPEQFPLPSGRFGQPLLIVADTVYPLDSVSEVPVAKGGKLSFLVNVRGGLFSSSTGTYKVTVEMVKP